jgi:DNA methylase
VAAGCRGSARLSDRGVELARVAPTQESLYADIDLELSWSERQLPERERTKHVHRLHPYLGKFIPQLVEVLLERYFRPGQHVLDPFAGSGTTAVQALESGLDGTAVELAAFNCLLISVKTARYEPFGLERELRDACARLDRFDGTDAAVESDYLRAWYAPAALAELLFWHGLVPEFEHADVLRVVLSRAARSARRAPHFDLEAPREPQVGEYWCHKHRRVCRPVGTARQFLRRYAEDTVRRIREFGRVRSRPREATVVHADARSVAYERRFDGIVTSPPYPGLIDYHEQHRYAYELLGLEDRRAAELGAAEDGTTRAALAAYGDGVVGALANAASSLKCGAPVVIVVNDRRDLYPEILERAGLRLEERLRRHVNRRTGRRAGEFFEDVLVARTV